MLHAIELTAQRIESIKLVLGGDYFPSALRDELIVMPGWSYTEELGWLERGEVAKVLSDAKKLAWFCSIQPRITLMLTLLNYSNICLQASR